VVSIRRVSLGSAYRYLLKSVAAGDGAAERPSSLSRYYASSGTPPGVFIGSGLSALDDSRGVKVGTLVTEEHMANMFAAMADPVSGKPVGGVPKAPAGAVPVAGFDLTFSPPKSVSVAWALADEATKAVIYDCHRRAGEYVLAYGEKDVFRSRSGTNGIVEEDVAGVVAASFTHWSSRANDPQLHSHVVVWNRAQSLSDGRWRTLDSRALFKATTTMSELHQGVLSDLLTEALGYGWEARARRHSARPRYEVTGVPEALMAEFSRRSEQVDRWRAEAVEAFVAAHGRQPGPVEGMRIRQAATIATRPAKSHRSLSELTEEWRDRAVRHVARERQVAWVASLAGRNDLPLLRSADLAEPILADAAEAVLAEVAERHATFSRMNLLAEAHRLLHGARFASPDQRVEVAKRVTALATARSVALAPASEAHVPRRYQRPDGSSRLRPESRVAYTTQALLDAEARLLEAGRDITGPSVPMATVAAVADANLPGRAYRLSLDQAVAVEKIATSGRVLEVLVGPAGTGKSTTMAGLRAAWEAAHGPGSVVGLAPSAAAAEVLAQELGIATENTAKWLTEWHRIPELVARRRVLAERLQRHPRPLSPGAQQLRLAVTAQDDDIVARKLRPGQLVVVDEASLAGTFSLDELVSAAKGAGAKVLLAGDWAQLSAVDAGGAFGLVVRDRAELAPQLSEVRRFYNEWEKVASTALRLGREEAVATYEDHGRVFGGGRPEMLERLYQAWKADIAVGKSSLMIAPDAATVAELNRRAREERVDAGQVLAEGVALAGGQVAGVGDVVVTRENNRLLGTAKSWVKNGDRWTVTGANEDGGMALRRLSGNGEVTLPAEYVAHHVELAYATTAHRTQGCTVQSAHAFVSPTTTREALYVAATRGREVNRLYVDTRYDPDPATSHDGLAAPQNPTGVLVRVLARQGADLSAHEVRERASRQAASWAVLAPEYNTIAQEAQHQRWREVLAGCGLDDGTLQAVRESPAFGPLLASMREAEARGLKVAAVLPRLVRARKFDDATDPAAVLHGRLQRWTATAASKRRGGADLVAGLLPRALGVADPDIGRALAERDRAMCQRAREVAEEAIRSNHPWVVQLGPPPIEPGARAHWAESVTTVAAYRDRWGVTADDQPLGLQSGAVTVERARQHGLAQAAVERAIRLSRQARGAGAEPAVSRPITEEQGVAI
jgi:conjugative relaxase-like TrwC/TraI family protein